MLVYAPTLRIPLLEDDYPNIAEAQVYGATSQFPALAHHVAYRIRATSTWSTYWMWEAFGLRPWAFHSLSLALHILNTWLVFAIGLAWPKMRRAAFWAAAFFAVAEGHQEAVMWFSAINELWVFLFGALALWCWIEDRAWGIVPFALALVSKESAVIFLPLFLLVKPTRDVRKWIPYGLAAAVVTGSIFIAHSASFRFSDGSFVWSAPFWITWPRSMFRLLWFWGLISAGVVWFLGDVKARRTALAAAGWMAIALVPYIFLTYTTSVPSRQTYLASAGLAYLVGMAMSLLPDRRLVALAAGMMLAHNAGYIWIKKQAQFVERAAPTEQLMQLARQTTAPIWVRCFPRTTWIAEEAVHLGTGRPKTDLVWTEADAHSRHAVEYCYSGPLRRGRRSISPGR